MPVQQDSGQRAEAKKSGSGNERLAPPTINLPKGGGGLQSIGEKFAINSVTCTGSMTVPIATRSGRSGFGPRLLHSYSPGARNGSFEVAWDLSLPCIACKTDKGYPGISMTKNLVGATAV